MPSLLLNTYVPSVPTCAQNTTKRNTMQPTRRHASLTLILPKFHASYSYGKPAGEGKRELHKLGR